MAAGAQGAFLSVEGTDGAGKSTQIRRLGERLTALGHDVIMTREPGGTPGAEAIRALVMEGEPGRWSAETEILLFTAARRDHWERVIAPGLARGAVVITDRFVDSTRVYQGTSPERRAAIDALHALMIGVEPDLTLMIMLDAEEAAKRAAARGAGPSETRAGDRFETRGAAWHQGLTDRFQALAEEAPERIRLIDGAGAADEVAARIWAALPVALSWAPTGAPSGGPSGAPSGGPSGAPSGGPSGAPDG